MTNTTNPPSSQCSVSGRISISSARRPLLGASNADTPTEEEQLLGSMYQFISLLADSVQPQEEAATALTGQSGRAAAAESAEPELAPQNDHAISPQVLQPGGSDADR